MSPEVKVICPCNASGMRASARSPPVAARCRSPRPRPRAAPVPRSGISNSVFFFSRERRMTSRSGMWAIRLKPTARRSGRSRRCPGCGWRCSPPSAPCSSSPWPDRRDDAVHGEDRVEVVGGDDQRPVGVLQRGGEAAADHVAEHVEDHHVGVFEQVMLLQQLHRLADDIAAAAGAGGRAAGLDAHHAVVALVDEVLGAQLLGWKSTSSARRSPSAPGAWSA
jgi:hypothetical protein